MLDPCRHRGADRNSPESLSRACAQEICGGIDGTCGLAGAQCQRRHDNRNTPSDPTHLRAPHECAGTLGTVDLRPG